MRSIWYVLFGLGIGAGSLIGGLAMVRHLQTPPPVAATAAPTVTVVAATAGVTGVATKQDLARLRRDLIGIASRSGRPHEDANVATLQKQIQGLRVALARMQTELSDRRRQHGAAVNAPLDWSVAWLIDDDELSPDVVELEREERRERDHEAIRQHFDDIDAAFSAEPTDPAWSDAVNGRIRDAFANDAELLDTTLAGAECRTSRCRLEVWYDEGTDIGAVQMALLVTMADETPLFAVDSDDQDTDDTGKRVFIYLVKKGHRLLPD